MENYLSIQTPVLARETSSNLQCTGIYKWNMDVVTWVAVNDDNCDVVVGFETAESAEQKSSLSGQQVLEGFLSYLDEMFG